MNKKLFLSLVAICLLISSALDAQITNLTNAATPFPEFVGWNGAPFTTSKNLDVKNNFANRNILFFTNGTAVNGSSLPRVIILGNAGATQGFMGVNVPAPVQRLDVGGDINLRTPFGTANTGYRINNQPVLQVKNVRHTFVGIGAGASYTPGTNDNTFVGFNAGTANTTGFQNTFLGSSSGLVNTSGVRNTFLGVQAGFTNTGGNQNTCIGERAGASNTTGNSNTYVGSYTAHTGTSTADFNAFLGLDAGHDVTTGGSNTITGADAGYNITTGVQNVIGGRFAAFLINNGSNNVFFGWESALENVSGSANVFSGSRTGRNQLGNLCTFVGFEAGYDNTTNTYTLTNAAGFGANAVPTADNKMILGDNNVWVGIGLTNDLTPNFGPQNSLEINPVLNDLFRKQSY